MNFKERGITVGDLLIVFIIIIFSTFIFKKISNDEKTSQTLVKVEILTLFNL